MFHVLLSYTQHIFLSIVKYMNTSTQNIPYKYAHLGQIETADLSSRTQLNQYFRYSIKSTIISPSDLILGDTIQYKIDIVNTGNVTINVQIENGQIYQLLPGQIYTYNGSHQITETDVTVGTVDLTTIVHIYNYLSILHNTETIPIIYDIILPCIMCNAMILMGDDTLKQIQDIKRGDIVYGNLKRTKKYTVSRVVINEIRKSRIIEYTTIMPGALGEQMPNMPLTMSSNHPVIWKKSRRPIKCFINFGNICHAKDAVENILWLDSQRKYAWYDLQFDTAGSYIANGLMMQSRHPLSIMTPLPRDLFFEKERFSQSRVNDNYIDKYRLDTNPVFGVNLHQKVIKKNNDVYNTL